MAQDHDLSLATPASGITEEMVKAGIAVFNTHLSDRFAVSGYGSADRLVTEIYLAMQDAGESPRPTP